MVWELFKRGRKADLYRDSADHTKFQARIHEQPINYYDDIAEEWVPTDTTPVESTGDYDWEMIEAEFQAFFPTLTQAPIKFLVGDTVGHRGNDHEFTLEILDASYWDEENNDDYLGSPAEVTGTAESSPNRVAYADVYDAVGVLEIDLEYILKNFGMKEFFIIKNKPRDPAGYLVGEVELGFNEIIVHPTTDMWVDGVKITPGTQPFFTSKEIIFKDSGENDKFKLPPPFAIDDNGVVVGCNYRIKKVGNKVHLTLLTPWAWLDDVARAYPVRVDSSPETIAAAFDINTVNADAAFANPYQTTILTGRDVSLGILRIGIDFDTNIIPDAAAISQVDIKLYVDSITGTPDSVDMDEMVGGGSPSGQGAAETYYNDTNPSDFYSDADGETYLSQSSAFGSTGWKQVTLLSQANTDLQNQLLTDWFSVGITIHTEASGDVIHFRSAEAGINTPQIIVTFSGAIEITGTIDAQSGVSALLSATKKVTGSLTAQSAVSASLSAIKPVTGSIAVVSGMSGDITTSLDFSKRHKVRVELYINSQRIRTWNAITISGQLNQLRDVEIKIGNPDGNWSGFFQQWQDIEVWLSWGGAPKQYFIGEIDRDVEDLSKSSGNILTIHGRDKGLIMQKEKTVDDEFEAYPQISGAYALDIINFINGQMSTPLPLIGTRSKKDVSMDYEFNDTDDTLDLLNKLAEYGGYRWRIDADGRLLLFQPYDLDSANCIKAFVVGDRDNFTLPVTHVAQISGYSFGEDWQRAYSVLKLVGKDTSVVLSDTESISANGRIEERVEDSGLLSDSIHAVGQNLLDEHKDALKSLNFKAKGDPLLYMGAVVYMDDLKWRLSKETTKYYEIIGITDSITQSSWIQDIILGFETEKFSDYLQ